MKDADGWTQVGLAVVTIALTLWLVRRERRPKGLAYVILSNRAIVTAHSRFPLEVRFDGKPVRAPHLLVWRLVNTGAQPIQVADYETDIEFNLTGSTIVSADVTLTRPSSLRMKIAVAEPHRVLLERRLLNPGDLVEVQMLVDGQPSSIDVTCRIAGVTRIALTKMPQTSWGQPWKFGKVDAVMAAIPLVMFGALGIFLAVGGDDRGTRILGWVVAAFALFIYPTLLWQKTRKNRLFLGS